MRALILTLFISLTLSVQAQQSQGARFKLSVVSDSILLGHSLTAHFSLTLKGSNSPEEVIFPDFADFYVTPGPTNFQTNIINGSITRVNNYSFRLEPKTVGDVYIAPASVKVGDRYLETDPFLIRVYPNPDNIPQAPSSPSIEWGNSPFGNDFFGNDFEQGGMNFDFFGQGFENLDSLSENFFQQFFEQSPFFGQELFPMVPDSTLEQQTRKRKTTRI